MRAGLGGLRQGKGGGLWPADGGVHPLSSPISRARLGHKGYRRVGVCIRQLVNEMKSKGTDKSSTAASRDGLTALASANSTGEQRGACFSNDSLAARLEPRDLSSCSKLVREGRRQPLH